MVERVFVHIGLPKTATSYLQTIIWGNREQLRSVGVTVPGSERRDHLWSSREIREDKHHASAPRATPDRLVPGTHGAGAGPPAPA